MAEKKTKLNDIPIKFRSRFADIPKDPDATKYDRETDNSGAKSSPYEIEGGVENMLPEMAAGLGIGAVIVFGSAQLNEIRHFINDKSKSSSTADVAKQLAREIKRRV